ncbi:MAG: SMI1/KNR4 family protein [Proteocatella sp.]
MEMKIAEQYVSGLKKAYFSNGESKIWNDFEEIKHGVSKEDIINLKKEYPDIPDSLVALLEYVDGTYWREYEGKKIVFYFLGSDIEEYPYYLLSAKQILETKNEAFDYYSDYVDRCFGEDVPVDEKIIENSDLMKWLHFSDCMNNGGTSQLFIDFSPSEKGVSGQIIRYIHDPDEIEVIAESFDKYLEMLINNNYDFINEDTVE